MKTNDLLSVFEREIGEWGAATFDKGGKGRPIARQRALIDHAQDELEEYTVDVTQVGELVDVFILLVDMQYINIKRNGSQSLEARYKNNGHEKMGLDDIIKRVATKGMSHILARTAKSKVWQQQALFSLQACLTRLHGDPSYETALYNAMNILFFFAWLYRDKKVSFSELVCRKMEINRKRKWGQPDSRGVIRHKTKRV